MSKRPLQVGDRVCLRGTDIRGTIARFIDQWGEKRAYIKTHENLEYGAFLLPLLVRLVPRKKLATDAIDWDDPNLKFRLTAKGRRMAEERARKKSAPKAETPRLRLWVHTGVDKGEHAFGPVVGSENAVFDRDLFRPLTFSELFTPDEIKDALGTNARRWDVR